MAEERIVDVEKNGAEETHLANNRVHSLAWEGVNVSAAKLTKPIIADVDGLASAGKSTFIICQNTVIERRRPQVN